MANGDIMVFEPELKVYDISAQEEIDELKAQLINMASALDSVTLQRDQAIQCALDAQKDFEGEKGLLDVMTEAYGRVGDELEQARADHAQQTEEMQKIADEKRIGAYFMGGIIGAGVVFLVLLVTLMCR